MGAFDRVKSLFGKGKKKGGGGHAAPEPAAAAVSNAAAVGAVPAAGGKAGGTKLEAMKEKLKKKTMDKDDYKDEKTGELTSNYAKIMSTVDQIIPYFLMTAPLDRASHRKFIDKLIDRYNELISQCKAFLQQDKRRISFASRNRKRYVEYVLEIAEREWSVIAAAPPGADMRVVLADARVEEIDANLMDRDNVGAGTSDVFKITGRGYFKKESIVADNIYTVVKNEFEERGSDFFEKFEHLLPNLLKIAPGYGMQVTPEIGEDIVTFTINMMYSIDQNTSGTVLDLAYSKSDVEFSAEDKAQFLNILAKAEKYKNLSEVMGDARIKTGQDISKRNVAASRLAAILGEDALFAKSQTVDLVEGNKKTRGNLMAEAVGVDDKVLESRKKAGQRMDFSSPQLQRSLMCIQLIDTLSAQIDHHFGNIFAQMDEEGNITGAQAIDNDIAFGTYTDLKKKNKHLRQFEDENTGDFVGGLVDKELANRILKLEPEILKFAFIDLLSEEEIDALLKRFNTVKNVLQKMMDNKDSRLVGRDAWGADTAARLMAHDKNMYRDFVEKYTIG